LIFICPSPFVRLMRDDTAASSASRLAVIIAHIYMRKREAELLARWKMFFEYVKAGLVTRLRLCGRLDD
jgi:hypothetical protein